MFWIAATGDRRKRLRIKWSRESDDAEVVRMASIGMVFSRRFDGGFDRLRSGIGKKCVIREACFDKAGSKTLRLRDLEQIGCVPELCALFLQSRNEVRVCISERSHGDAAAKIEVPLAFCRDQPSSFATLKCERKPGVGWKKRRCHHLLHETGGQGVHASGEVASPVERVERRSTLASSPHYDLFRRRRGRSGFPGIRFICLRLCRFEAFALLFGAFLQFL